MNRIRPLQHPPTDNDDASSLSESREEPINVVIAEQVSDEPTLAGARNFFSATRTFVENKCPSLLHFSSYTLGVLLILCVTIIWVASSNWIQYIFGNLNYSKPYFLTYFNTTGFSLWNMGHYLVPKWSKIPWDDRERPQPILVEDDDVVLEDPQRPNATAAAAGDAEPARLGAGYFGRRGGAAAAGDGGEVVVVAGGHNRPARRNGGSHWRYPLQRDNNASIPLNANGEPNYGTDIRAWAIDNGYNPSIFSSEQSSFSSVSVEEVIDLGDVPDLLGAHSRTPAAPFLILEARENAAAAAAAAGNGHLSWQQRQQLLQPQRRLARVERVRPYARRKIWFWAAVFCPFWFFANYLFNVSLSITSVASNTVLSATSSIWTLLLSYLLLHESVGPLKWLAIALCVTGSIMVGLSDRNSSGSTTNTILGDVIALISAFFYAVYTSILRYGLPEDERYAMGMVFGAVGAINFVCLWPGLVFVDLVGLEKLVWPAASQFWPLLLNSLIGTNLSDVLWARSVVLTSPVVATLGLALTTPLAMIVDAIFKGTRFSAVYVVGAVLVMCGFLLVNLPILERWPPWLRRFCRTAHL